MRVFVHWVLSSFLLSKISTLSHLFKNIFLSKKPYDIGLLYDCLPSLLCLFNNYKSKEWHKCRKLYSEKQCKLQTIFLNKNNKVRARFLAKSNNENIFSVCIFIPNLAGYTGSACLPQISDFLSKTFILEMKSHRSYANLHSQVTVWHGWWCM